MLLLVETWNAFAPYVWCMRGNKRKGVGGLVTEKEQCSVWFPTPTGFLQTKQRTSRPLDPVWTLSSHTHIRGRTQRTHPLGNTALAIAPRRGTLVCGTEPNWYRKKKNWSEAGGSVGPRTHSVKHIDTTSHTCTDSQTALTNLLSTAKQARPTRPNTKLQRSCTPAAARTLPTCSPYWLDKKQQPNNADVFALFLCFINF